MSHSLPSIILVGIPLDADKSKELLSWTIKVLAQPGDIIVAMHVIADKWNKKATDNDGRKKDNLKKQNSTREHQNQIRQAKSFVISITGELFKTCQSIEVNLEVRVGSHSSTGKCLIEEVKNMDANYLVIGRKKNKTNRAPWTISRYCVEHVPECCSLVVLQKNFRPNSVHNQEVNHQSNSLWSEKNSYTNDSFSSEENKTTSDNIYQKASPKTVLDMFKEESDSFKSGESSYSSSNINTSLMVYTGCTAKTAILQKSLISPFKRISSLFRAASHDRSMAKKTDSFRNNENQQSSLKWFSYDEIARATNHFQAENMIGKGGYSEVYRGDSNGRRIAVKRLAKDNSNPTKQNEFLMELGIIAHVNHPNAAKLIGYCVENGLYLIFTCYSNGNLSSALHGETSKSLNWPIRYKIVLGIARSVHYLHKCCKHRIIHRDIKASNVLLGPDYEPFISDFGLAKWLPSKWTHQAAFPIEGTFGYLAPEYFTHGIVDEKTDVFAFGILLLEIITGRRPVDSTKQNLLQWARPLMEFGKLSELVDPKLEGRYDMSQLYRVTLTASHCVRQSPRWRPSMNEVLELLRQDCDMDVASSWRIPKFTSDEMDDYSITYGYQLPSDLALQDIL